jgi:DNA mismatch repair protein MutS2
MADAVTSAVKRVEGARKVTAATRARTEAIREIREAQQEALPEAAPAQVPLRVGDRVRVQGMGVLGDVLGFPEEGSVEVAISGKRLRVSRADASPVGVSPRPVAPTLAPQKDVKPEINLVGLTVEEALPQVDKLLDDAALGDQKSIRVIHGFGSGRLRRAVASLLEGHPHVAAFRIGGAKEGGGGVTVVELKD